MTYTSADAVDRETAWLRTSGDGLPALLKEAGGPFDIIQAYVARTPPTERRALYVTRNQLRSVRFAAIRQQNKHPLRLHIWWPANDQGGEVENDQRELDVAIDAVFARIRGPVGDKTHGGRFLAVGEEGDTTAVFGDPARTLAEAAVLLVDVTYLAVDIETLG